METDRGRGLLCRYFALVVVFVPLVLALHFHHVDDKRKLHNLYSTDDDRSVNRTFTILI